MAASNNSYPGAYSIGNATLANGINIFYRTAGAPTAPVILLLHGFPSSSHQYRHLIPLLANAGYRVLAPDYPGFGFTTVPDTLHYTYTFDNLAATTAEFLQHLGVQEFAVYVFDYGAPVGFRLALSGHFHIRALISQNGNAYEEGLGPGIQPLLAYGADKTSASKAAAVAEYLTLPSIKSQYVTVTEAASAQSKPGIDVVEPESYHLDYYLVNRPGNPEVQLALAGDYVSNVAMYPKWHAWLRETQTPVLAVWGNEDPIFLPPGAEAYKKDVKDAKVVLLDGPHFLLETSLARVGPLLVEFLQEKGIK